MIFCDFCSILGRPRPSKKLKKIEKIRFGTLLERVSDFSSILEAILERFWLDLGWILAGFGKIFEAFWKDLDKKTMIRATKGRLVGYMG